VPIYKLKTFARFAWDEGISDASLADAIERAERGLIDANLGGHLIKQRVARQGQGRSGGHRVLIAYRGASFSLFLYGFAKKDRENLDAKEMRFVRELADAWLNASPNAVREALQDGKLIEVTR